MLSFGSNRAARSLAAGVVGLSLAVAASQGRAQQPALTYADQGWSTQERTTFYTTSQGSRMIPLAWFKALRRLDVDEPFAADQLKRYGYLPSDPPNADGLPIGFVPDKREPAQLGMTCAACHTNQLEYQKDGATHVLRIDGAPALADFQQFLLDLTAVARATLNQPARFADFAKAVLGNGVTPAQSAQLKKDFQVWVTQFGIFMDQSLPAAPWGPGRLDAFGMIFNRVTAKDLNIPGNFRKADAPVSYPFLWNASRQDKTQWNGGVPNGLFIRALGRNTGEVFGVFGDFSPSVFSPAIGPIPKQIQYKPTSADFNGLQTLEEQIATLKPPPWPRDVFGLNAALAAKGEVLFRMNCSKGCHEEKRSLDLQLGLRRDSWVTPVLPVGTDEKMVRNSERQVNPGVYLGSLLPPPVTLTSIGQRFTNPASAVDVLASSVVGSLTAEAIFPPPIPLESSGVWRALHKDLEDQLAGNPIENVLQLGDLPERVRTLVGGLFKQPTLPGAPAAYESRVLRGIWATAPYLHNGSVPNLWELLKRPRDRVTSFKVGSRKFDPKNVGFATDESPYKSGTFTVDPANRNGNGNGGHDYTQNLSDDDRWAIIEYLKVIGEP